MSEATVASIMKSASEGELLEKDEGLLPVINTVDIEMKDSPALTYPHESRPKLKRTFTLPRFGKARMSKRRGKHKGSSESVNKDSVLNITANSDNSKNGKKVFKISSLKNFINKVVHHVSSVSVNNKNYRNYDYMTRRRADRTVSLSSSDVRVPPTRPLHQIPGDKVPGVIGLRNHGNTCFINAVLQCLCHTDILAEYFVLDMYKADLSRRNKLNSKKYGTKGEVTEQLAVLLKAIWACQYDPELSTQFKSVVDKYGSQFRGNNQHDAQEFLLWLLDKVHEDLNTATKKKYKAIKNSVGRPDDVVAAETLANHIRCNNSFVYALFQAQFRSSLTCPQCRCQSNTFDPFLCVSVPVPQNQRRPVYVTVLYTSQQPRQVKLGLTLPPHADIRELREVLASDTKIDEQHMLITEVDDLGFHRTFSDSAPLNTIKENDPVYCLELPQLKEATQDTGEYLLLVWVNALMVEDHGIRFGSPYTMQVGRETAYDDLQKLILKEMANILHDDVLTGGQPASLFRIRVLDGLSGSYLDPGVDHPLYVEAIDQALALCEEDAGPLHVRLVLEWDLETKESTIADDSDPMEEHASVKQLQQSSEQGGAVTLEECFQLYTRAEVLGTDNAWHCPSCKSKQEVEKRLGLWTLPDILVVHLKRFRQSSAKQRSPAKLTTLVNFPLYGFDMTPHLAPAAQDNSGMQTLGGLGWSPWKRPRRHHSGSRYDDNVYDLYAVCNHHGQDLQLGHYTAYCRNPYDTQWYRFDDSRVDTVAESALVTPSAYMLFYQRRGLGGSTSSSSSAASSSSAGSTDHWVYRMPRPAPPASQSSEEISKKSGEVEQGTNEEDNDSKTNFQRNSRNYSTLQPSSKRSIATETDSSELDRHSDDEAATGASLGWSQHVSSAKTSPKLEINKNETCSLLADDTVSTIEKQVGDLNERDVICKSPEPDVTESRV
ncbi:ubiquitin carboxyl-terminal hydrolase 31 [Frankliniella occidentalis]|uniref:Ubiquitin carboxyl-terminal hydrolase n=1 Tax=Frankliniella occidentalis TaxID=133901 RepID=A0A6J1SEC0_FRAOC|nr:ubiquitin carboxyl-terminal hydrolase 31 [Frankliniella occidentalis]